MTRPFDTFIGIDLGGARGKTTAVAWLAASGPSVDGSSEPPIASVERVLVRGSDAEPWHDAALLEALAGAGDRAVIAVNAPLTVPACVRCALAECPGKSRCVDPAVIWLRSEGVAIAREAAQQQQRDRDRIAAVPSGRPERAESARGPSARLEPYLHRGAEVVLHYQRGLLPRGALGLATGPIAARGVHLRRRLAPLGFALNRNLLEVSPRATVHALFGPREARGYKRDADPWLTRAGIVERLAIEFAPRSRLAREDVLRNDHCFEALISAYTAFLWAREGWTMPEGEPFGRDGWIWAPA